MNVKIFYKQGEDHTRPVIEYLHDFEKRTAKKLEEVDPESPQGSMYLELYDIVEYPTIIATDDDGKLLESWRGLPLPTIDEVSYYV